MSKYNQTPEQAIKSALAALSQNKTTPADIAHARDILVDAIDIAPATPTTLPNGDQDDRDDFPRELWTPAELEAEQQEQAQAQEEADLLAHLRWEAEQEAEAEKANADASAALATNDRDGWDGAATRAEQLEERDYISMRSSFLGI